MTLSFEQFWKEQAEWSRATFGSDQERGPVGPLKHLALEVLIELLGYDEPKVRAFLNAHEPTKHKVDILAIEPRERARMDKSFLENTAKFTFKDSEKMCFEFADLLFLVIDAARRAGMNPSLLLCTAFAKLATNKARRWNVPTKDGAVEHVREIGGEG